MLHGKIDLKCVNRLFSGDGRWRHVIRRCASVSDTGVTGVCNWGVYENGDYWEECYCSHDSCNGSGQNEISTLSLVIGTIVSVYLAIFTKIGHMYTQLQRRIFFDNHYCLILSKTLKLTFGFWKNPSIYLKCYRLDNVRLFFEQNFYTNKFYL